MATTYLSPGVYVQEVPAGVQPIEGVGTSTGAFVGLAERGLPNQPRLITNFTQFVNEFGRFEDSKRLALAVFSFFAEGGTRCYVTRVVGSGAAAATITLDGGDASDSLKFDATSPGIWGNRVTLAIATPTNADPSTHFRLTVRLINTAGEDEAVEVYDDVNADTVSAAVNGVSRYVNVTYIPLSSGEASRTLVNKRPANNADVDLAAGAEGTSPNFIGVANDLTGLYSFDAIDDINIVAIPDLVDLAPASFRSNTISAVAYCENRGDCFYLIDAPKNVAPTEMVQFKQGTGATWTGSAFTSSYSAIYYPWVQVTHPVTRALVTMPPSGLMAGIYANTDSVRGVFKAPAGTADGRIRTAISAERLITPGEQDVLNPIGVNVIRTFAQSGVVVWGARTTSSQAEFRYVPVRRLLLFIAESLDEGTQFAVFEPNDPTLWGKVRRTLTAFLTRVWRDGALFGATPDEAFFVKVDEENNPPEVRDAGQLIVDVGVAPVKPAEFVVIRIQQATQANS